MSSTVFFRLGIDVLAQQKGERLFYFNFHEIDLKKVSRMFNYRRLWLSRGQFSSFVYPFPARSLPELTGAYRRILKIAHNSRETYFNILRGIEGMHLFGFLS